MVDPESLKAALAVSKELVTASREAGSYIGNVIGDLPRDFIALIAGDKIKHKRIRNLAVLEDQTMEILQRRAIAPPYEEIDPKIEEPLLIAAADDGRPEIAKLWAELLAAAMDPNRKGAVRQSFIDAVKGLDPLDALILNAHDKYTRKPIAPNVFPQDNKNEFYAATFSVSRDEVNVSVENLMRLGIIMNNATDPDNAPMTSFGRLLLKTLRD